MGDEVVGFVIWRLAMLGALIAAAILQACSASPLSHEVKVGETCAESTKASDVRYVRVLSANSECGGAVVGPHTVITAAHCIIDEHDTEVEIDGVGVEAKPVLVDRREDHAQLEIAQAMPAVFPFGDPPLPGDELTIFGTGCTGELESRRGVSEGGDLVNGCACHGDSGSPVLNVRGEIVGTLRGFTRPQEDFEYAFSTVEHWCCDLSGDLVMP